MEKEILSLSGVGGAVDILSSVRKANAKLKFCPILQEKVTSLM